MGSEMCIRDSYTAQAMREELQRLLQDGAFQGRIPEGSGTQYLVEGSGNEIRVRTNETLVRADEFYILPDAFLKVRYNARKFTTAWSAEQPRSVPGQRSQPEPESDLWSG